MARSAYFLFVFYEKQLFSRGRRHTRFFDAHVPEYVYAQKKRAFLDREKISYFLQNPSKPAPAFFAALSAAV